MEMLGPVGRIAGDEKEKERTTLESPCIRIFTAATAYSSVAWNVNFGGANGGVCELWWV